MRFFGPLVLILVGLAALNCSEAQTASPNPASQTKDNGVFTPENYTGDPYIFELIETQVRFEADGRGQRDLTTRVRIQSESAVREFGLQVYSYASSFESLDVLSVRVRKPDGTTLETPPSDIQELDTAVSRAAPMYSDQREKHIAVKSLAVSDVVELHLRWTIHDPMAPGHFWYDHSLYRAGICLRETLKIDVPTNVAVKLRSPDPQPTVREEGGRRIYAFQTSNLKKLEESKIPAWERNFHGEPPPDVQLSSFASWEEVGKWFGALMQSKVTVTPEMQAKYNELTKGKNSEEEKVRVLYEFVSTRFRYIGVDLGLSRFTPHSAAEVLSNRYGDCKDKHVLFAALLQAAGITAYPALISSRFRIDPSLPTMSVFDHVITAIPRGSGYEFLDSTPEVAPFGALVLSIRDRHALVIPAGLQAQLVKTPVDLPFPAYERFRMDSSIDANGTVEATMHLENRGDGELAMRLAYHTVPQNRWETLTQALVGRLGYAGTVSDVKVTQAEDTGMPFSVDLTYRRTDYPDWKNHRFTLPFPSVLIPSLNEEQKLSKEPLPLGSPTRITFETSVKLPPGYSATAPANVEKKTDFAEFSATYSIEKGVLKGVFNLQTLQREMPGSQRGEYSSLVKIIDETARRYIFVNEIHASDSQGSSSAPGKPHQPSSTAKPIYEAADRADKDNNFSVSAQLYEQVTALDPNFADAWNRLAFAYGKVGKIQMEEAAFRKALALDPASRWAHYNLGNVLMAQKRYDEAISEYQKEIQSKSNNSLVHLNLGRVFVLSGQPDKGIPELEIAAGLMPKNPAVQFNLGLAYAKTGQPEKAAQAFIQSVELEPTVERKNSVAYEMAMNKLKLDQAEKYAESAIETVAAKTKDLSLDNLSNDDVRVPSSLGAYWDTLGWVKFQEGDLAAAEKYVRSAWQVRSIGEIGDHLGQIYEKQGQKEEAEKFYAMAMAAPGAMAETQLRLGSLVGGSVEADRMAKEATASLAESHTIAIKNAKGAEGTGEFWVLVVPGLKISAAKFISGDAELRGLTDILQSTMFPETFPDDKEIKLLRRGKLTCLKNADPCRLLVSSAETVRSVN
jgi:tetratricopeptide (TPR) repeat protein